MKNKIIVLILVLILGFTFNSQVNSEDFIFESDYIELKDNGNIIEARNGVKIITANNIEITAKNSFYNKLNSKLLLKGEVIIFDKEKNLKILSEETLYHKDTEQIITVGKTVAYIENKFTITTKNLEYLKKKDTIQSKFKTSLLDKLNNKIHSENFKYLIDKKLFHGNNMNMQDKDQNNYFFEKSMIDLNKNMILAKDVEINFAKNIFDNSSNDPRLRGNSLTGDGNVTIIKDGIFTTCKINDTCPPWTLKASEIKHDKVKKTITYKDAWLKIYDKPVLYFPKFFHPDPTVKRQSGFLKPSMLNASSSGNSLILPYFKVLAENKDLTVTPRVYFNGDMIIQNEFRQIEKNYENNLDFSVKTQKNTTKSHFFSNSKFDLDYSDFDYSNFEMNLETTSNDTYLKTDKIITKQKVNNTLLTSYLDFNASNDNLDVSVDFRIYEDLSIIDKSDRFEYVYPNFSITKILETSFDSMGTFDYQIQGFQKKYNTNITEKLLINNLKFISKPFFSRLGFKNNFELFLKNSNKDGKRSATYKDELETGVYSSIIVNSYLPLSKKSTHFESEFVPKMSLRYNPAKSENLSILDRRINNTNIFSSNRLGVNDSLEGGQSLTLGTEYNLNNNNGSEILGINFAQIFRDINDKNLPITSKMNTKSSDLVGDIKFKPNNYVDFEYDFSLDNNLKTSNYNMAKSTVSINNFVTTFEFLEENNEIGSESYLSNKTSYNFNQSNKLLFRQRTNRKTNLKEFYNLVYQYENDCLVASIEYNKDYYTDRDLKQTEELFFSLTIVPFANVGSPKISK